MISWLALMASLLLTPLAHGNQPLNRIVAVVNDGVILESQLDRRTRQIRQQLQAREARMPDDSVLRKQVLERLIVEEIQLQLAASGSIRIDDELVNANLRKIADANKMDLSSFRKVLEQEGFSFSDFREEIRNELTMQQLRAQQVDSRIQVSEQEIDNLLTGNEAAGEQRELLLSHILIAVPEAASTAQLQAARTQAEALVAELRGGADFSERAIALSAGQTALEGGSLGWRQAGQLPSQFAETALAMNKGDISDPIQSPSGFHIVRLDDVRGEERHVIIQTHARHILLRPDELLSEAEVRSRLLQLKQRIEGGDDFQELARAHSKDPVSAARGGDLGWSNPGEMVPAFEQVLNRLKPGAVSEPF